jgi:hypothetical protein
MVRPGFLYQPQLPVFLRRFTVFHLEAPGEIELVAEAEALADLKHGQVTF